MIDSKQVTTLVALAHDIGPTARATTTNTPPSYRELIESVTTPNVPAVSSVGFEAR